MTTLSVQLRSIPDTQAVMGWAEGHTIVVDRPDGRAGGMGLGFNGGQLLALAIGGCFCNGIHVAVTAADKSADVDGVIRRAKEISSVSSSVRRGVPIHIVGG